MNICLFNPALEDNRGTPSSNLGDLIIETSVRRELARFAGEARIFPISTQEYPKPKQLGRILRSGLRLVGGTNLLSSNMDSYNQWKINHFHAGLIRNAVLMGVGWWQYQDKPNKYTRRLLRKCLSRKWMHSVRDDYTLQMLKSIGIDNVINTGCPTMWSLADIRSEDYPREKADSVLLMLTDYISLHVQPELDVTLVELLLEKYQTVYFWPQGRQDLELVEKWKDRLRILDRDMDALYRLLESSEPLDYVGTRLHGGVACLQARRRALILEVDNRAREIAKDTNLTTCARDDFEFISRWIDGPTDTAIRMDTRAIRLWREQFTPESLRIGRPASSALVTPEIKATQGKPLMLNLGCGRTFANSWINIDFIPHDAGVLAHDLRKPLPVQRDICDAVYASHVLEHFTRTEARTFLKECHRVLRPGGILRIVVPDLEMIARLYLQYLERAAAGDPLAAARHEWMTLELLDQLTRTRSGGEVLRYWRQDPMPEEDFVIERTGGEVRRFLEATRSSGQRLVLPDHDPSPEEYMKFRETGENHKWMYDRVSLRSLLKETGFIDVRQCGAADSSIAGYASFYLDTDPEGMIRKPDSFFMEATKPG